MNIGGTVKRLGRTVAALFVVLSTISAFPAHGAELRIVRIGLVNASSDVGFFIADKKGYFAQEGIKAEFIEFDSGARMVAPLGNCATRGRRRFGRGRPLQRRRARHRDPDRR